MVSPVGVEPTTLGSQALCHTVRSQREHPRTICEGGSVFSSVPVSSRPLRLTLMELPDRNSVTRGQHLRLFLTRGEQRPHVKGWEQLAFVLPGGLPPAVAQPWRREALASLPTNREQR